MADKVPDLDISQHHMDFTPDNSKVPTNKMAFRKLQRLPNGRLGVTYIDAYGIPIDDLNGYTIIDQGIGDLPLGRTIPPVDTGTGSPSGDTPPATTPPGDTPPVETAGKRNRHSKTPIDYEPYNPPKGTVGSGGIGGLIEGARQGFVQLGKALSGEFTPGEDNSSGGGGTPEDIDLADSKDSVDAATKVIKKFEGYRASAYKDNDGRYRVGYGSSTITLSNGSVLKVNKNTTVTKAGAERDLQRRITKEFVPGIIKDVGQEAWDKLSVPTQAALTSVAYNYGSIGKGGANIADAVKSGDPAKIADAVEGLRNQNDGINANRRLSEAALIRGVPAATEQSNLANKPLPAPAPLTPQSNLSDINDQRNAQQQQATHSNMATAQQALTGLKGVVGDTTPLTPPPSNMGVSAPTLADTRSEQAMARAGSGMRSIATEGVAQAGSSQMSAARPAVADDLIARTDPSNPEYNVPLNNTPVPDASFLNVQPANQGIGGVPPDQRGTLPNTPPVANAPAYPAKPLDMRSPSGTFPPVPGDINNVTPGGIGGLNSAGSQEMRTPSNLGIAYPSENNSISMSDGLGFDGGLQQATQTPSTQDQIDPDSVTIPDQSQDNSYVEGYANTPQGTGNSALDAISQATYQAPELDPDAPYKDSYLQQINKAEGSPDVNTLFGYKTVDPTYDHPNQKVFYDNGNAWSTAAGYGQINYPTWQEYANKVGGADFSSLDDQKKVMWQIASDNYATTTGRDLLTDLKSGNPDYIGSAFVNNNNRWASLPGGRSPQSDINGLVNGYNQSVNAYINNKDVVPADRSDRGGLASISSSPEWVSGGTGGIANQGRVATGGGTGNQNSKSEDRSSSGGVGSKTSSTQKVTSSTGGSETVAERNAMSDTRGIATSSGSSKVGGGTGTVSGGGSKASGGTISGGGGIAGGASKTSGGTTKTAAEKYQEEKNKQIM